MEDAPPIPPAPVPSEAVASRERWFRRFVALMDLAIPPELLTSPDSARHARLNVSFGLMGAIFGAVYAVFYLCIGHVWGAGIILVCSSLMIVATGILRRTKSTEMAGNFFSMTLTLGFLSLCFVEGGVHGHALAWLVSVPLCALLLIGRRSAVWWSIIAFVAASIVVGFNLAGCELPVTYDRRWEPVVSAAGYLGLIVFLFLLGIIFEVGRARAAAGMEKAVRELAASNERLQYLNEEKNEFLGIAAHDLRTPLTVVLGHAGLISMSSDPKSIARSSDLITQAATRMRGLIATLLDANAIEQGKYISDVKPCDLNQIVMDCVENHRAAAERKNIRLLVGTSTTLWARVDRAASLQVFDNLISNALKFSPPQTTIHIHTLPEKEFALVNVRDEGPGINAEDQKKLFKKFSRLSARPTAGESSTGLGLSIVKRLVEGMNGAIQCQSTVGMGTVFMVRLPVCPAEPSAQKSDSTAPSLPAITRSVQPKKLDPHSHN